MDRHRSTPDGSPPLIAASEQQGDGAAIGIDDQRAAIAPLAERPVAFAFDLDLVIEPDRAHVVGDEQVVELECHHPPPGRAGGPADLADGRLIVEHGVAHTGELAVEAGQGAPVEFDPWVEYREVKD